MNTEALQATEELASRLSPNQALAVIAIMPLVFFALFLWNRRSGGADAGQAIAVSTNALIDNLVAQAQRIEAMQKSFAAELEQLRAARTMVFVRASAIRDQAVAARTMVHELQRQLGLPETVFDELPALPPLDGSPAPLLRPDQGVAMAN